MTRPHGRQNRQAVGRILRYSDREQALAELALIPAHQVIAPLISHFCREDLIRFRSVTALGQVAACLAARRMEDARVLMRRLMWHLNEESGGIGWGAAEAMGEILSLSPDLAREFLPILFSYLDPRGNYIDHPLLQKGVIWGIGTCTAVYPGELPDSVQYELVQGIRSGDSVHRGYAVRALAAVPDGMDRTLAVHIREDTTVISLYAGWECDRVRICDLARPKEL